MIFYFENTVEMSMDPQYSRISAVAAVFVAAYNRTVFLVVLLIVIYYC